MRQIGALFAEVYAAPKDVLAQGVEGHRQRVARP
jgi:hypothetical protein